MNRWTGTGHLTKDPKFLETESGTAICMLRIAAKRAGKQGHDGYFDVKCCDAQPNACAQYLTAGREIAVDGRLLFDAFQTEDGQYASRIYVVAKRVEFLASRKASGGEAGDEASPEQPASDGAAREATGPPDHDRGPAAQHRPRAATTFTVTAMPPMTAKRHETVMRFLGALAGRPTGASCTSCATASTTVSAWARSSTVRPVCVDWRRGRSCFVAVATTCLSPAVSRSKPL